MNIRLRTSLVLLLAIIALASTPAPAQSSDLALRQSIAINAPVADVWALFSSEEGLRRWMAPLVELDLRVGGTIRSNYHADGVIGDADTIVNTILAYEPERMLSIKATNPPQDLKWADAIKDTWSVFYFEAIDDDRTLVRCHGLGYADTEDSQEMFDFFERGNEWVLNKLKEAAESGAEEGTVVDEDTALAAILAASRGESHIDNHAIVTVYDEPVRRQDFEAIIPAPREQVWGLMATSEGMTRFMGKYGVEPNIELAIGGAYEVFVPDKIIHTFVPGEMLCGEGSAPPEFPTVREGGLFWTMTFADAGEDRTRFRLSVLGWKDGEEWDNAFEYFVRNNAIYVNWIYDYFAAEYEPLPASEREFWHIERAIEIDASAADAWRALATSEGLAGWMAPDAHVDLRIGGVYETHFRPDAPAGERGMESTILSYLPGEMISYRGAPPANYPNLREDPPWIVWRMESRGNDSVLVRFDAFGNGQGDEWDRAHEQYSDAMDDAMQSLKSYVESTAD